MTWSWTIAKRIWARRQCLTSQYTLLFLSCSLAREKSVRRVGLLNALLFSVSIQVFGTTILIISWFLDFP